MDTNSSRSAIGLILLALLLFTGCASVKSTSQTQDELAQDGSSWEQTAAVNPDPWQGLNRAIFSFNTYVDKYTLKPLAKGYNLITPRFVRRGVSNVFSNLGEVTNLLNNLLQWQPRQAAKDTGRFLVNSTIGLAGLFDVAQHMGLKPSDGEDFGQTLAVWGVSDGPYLVLPFLGPSTLRDGLALPVDWYSDPRAYIDHVPTKNTVLGLTILDMRSGALELERHLTGDHYTFVRDAYLQRRHFLINNGEVEDSFGEDDFGDDEDYGY
jgi:phospholipid-binding lipoprotein MlaA